MKTCTKCKETKPYELFTKQKSSKDGFGSHCRACKKISEDVRRARVRERTCIYCDRPVIVVSTGLCSAHTRRLTLGLPMEDPVRSHGDGWITKQGYRRLRRPDHPNANNDGSIFEHTFIMSEHIGRPLEDHENVHHINGVRDDNRLENLELWSKSQPAGQRVEDKVAWAIELLKLYKPDILSA